MRSGGRCVYSGGNVCVCVLRGGSVCVCVRSGGEAVRVCVLIGKVCVLRGKCVCVCSEGNVCVF